MLRVPSLHNINYTLARRLCAWCILCVALLTYLLTLEPTASYWDCPEYIAVATGLQPGHPPGNPFWMLTARFFINFAPDSAHIALAVNIMSATCAALTIMLLFLTIEIFARHLVRPLTRPAHALCLGSAAVGALAFCWSDSFWFSAVEAEVYAYSSLGTALVFWLALQYYEHRHSPHADRYLILLAYLTGLAMGVHELNLLCLPALLLIVAYSLRDRLTCLQIILTLAGGLLAIAAVLFGIIPGFIYLAEQAELLCVNTWGWSFNSGLILTYTLLMLALLALALRLHTARRGPHRLMRILRVCTFSLFMLILGFSCYALILIRAYACPPLDTGHPADIFAFDAYFHRTQYGSSPLLYGAPFTAKPQRRLIVNGSDSSFHAFAVTNPKAIYTQGVKGMPHIAASSFATRRDSAANAKLQNRGSDWYQINTYTFEKKYPPEVCMWFPRMHSHNAADISGYYNWTGTTEADMYAPERITLAVDAHDSPVTIPAGATPLNKKQIRPTYLQNLQYFAIYQCAYMYGRYLLWNFVGRQNDYTGHGEPDAGNFITGIDRIDRLMLDVAADAPANAGADNKARNAYYALPLILGLMGLIHQICAGRRGRRQALLVTTLFILTGIAIVVYLNQGPVQARDRDYAFLGSWYAFCIWTGIGTLPLFSLLRRLLPRRTRTAAYLSIGLALCIPLQMLSQTYDDHDRSGRTATRDTAYNMLSGADRQAIIFSSQDNNIFPLWYMTEVEGYRRDVRIISYPYMTMSWYPRQWLMPMNDSRPVELTAPAPLLASDMLTFVKMGSDTTWTPALEALRDLYTDGVQACTKSRPGVYPILKTPRVFFTVGRDTVRLTLNRNQKGEYVSHRDQGEILTLDILATNAASPNPRPIYWTRPLGEDIFSGALKPYLERTGSLTRFNPAAPGLNAQATARLLLDTYRYGTAPGVLRSGRIPYFDPVAGYNIALVRSLAIETAHALSQTDSREDALTALALLEKAEREIPEAMVPYQAITLEPEVVGLHRIARFADEGLMAAESYIRIAETLDRTDLKERGERLHRNRMNALHAIEKYRASLRPQYRKYITYRLDYLLKALHPIPLPDTSQTAGCDTSGSIFPLSIGNLLSR